MTYKIPGGSVVPGALMLAVLALGADASVARGQTESSAERGSRIRLTAPGLALAEAVGTVTETTDDALTVEFESPRRRATVQRSQITQLDVSVGRPRSTLKGLGLGLLIGAGTGALIGFGSGDDESGFLTFTAEEKALIAGVGLGVTGGVVGLLVGAAHRRDVWSPARPSGPGLAVLPLLGRGGAGVSVAVALPVP